MLCLLERKSCENSSVLRAFLDFSGMIARMVTGCWRSPNIWEQTLFLTHHCAEKTTMKRVTTLTECYSYVFANEVKSGSRFHINWEISESVEISYAPLVMLKF